MILRELPGVTEQVDYPAKMVAYCYGQKYVEMVCTLIPSQKGLKLGFYIGVSLPDPEKLLEGTGKISRYVEIRRGNNSDNTISYCQNKIGYLKNNCVYLKNRIILLVNNNFVTYL